MRETAKLTGVSPDTLRKWEERYGIVTPTRLANGYRGYTAHDIALIRWLQQQLAGGARISLVAEVAAAAQSVKPTPLVLVGGRAVARAESLPEVPGIRFVRYPAAQILDSLQADLKLR